MTEYLFPYNDEVKIDETQRIFAIKKESRMVDTPYNFAQLK